MAVNDLGGYTLGEINVALLAGIGLINPLLLQVDLFMTGQFGLGPFMADINAQYSAAISAIAQLSIGVSDPLAAIKAAILALAQLTASLQLALSLPLPVLSIQATARISAMAALSASLALKIGGIKALLAAGAAVKIPMLKFVEQIVAALSLGPAHLLSFTGASLGVSGAQIAAQFAAGLGPSDPISPLELVDGIIIVTKDPLVFQALGLIIKTS
jgi:hypothetical protein